MTTKTTEIQVLHYRPSPDGKPTRFGDITLTRKVQPDFVEWARQCLNDSERSISEVSLIELEVVPYDLP